MIVSESGVKKIIREALEISDLRGKYKSSDPVYRCNLDNLRNSSDDSVVGKILFFLTRLLYYSPRGVSEKTFAEKLDLFLATGMTLTPLENEQYNKSIAQNMKTPGFKKSLIDKIETTLDIMFFPTTSGICRVVNGFFPDASEEQSFDSNIDVSNAREVFNAASLSMLDILGLTSAAGSSPYVQIFFPSTYLSISRGADPGDTDRERRLESQNLNNRILSQESLDVDDLFREIKRLHTGIGMSSRDKRIYLSSIDNFFRNLIDSGQGEKIEVAKQIREIIYDMVRQSSLSTP
jgi:hypothetical protein